MLLYILYNISIFMYMYIGIFLYVFCADYKDLIFVDLLHSQSNHLLPHILMPLGGNNQAIEIRHNLMFL